MKIKFLGATGTVTGSKYLITSGSASVLIDCGLFQGFKKHRLKNWEKLPINASGLTAVVLTHAHLDHSGYIPRLIKDGFRGKIYCTPSTRDLCKILLPDSGHLQEEECKYANKKGFSKHKPALPLYTAEEAQASLKYFRPVDYETHFSLGPELSIIFRNAGHILGSANVTLSDGNVSICFSGDVGRRDDVLLRPPVAPGSVDYLVVESTYGNREHPQTDRAQELADVINRTVKRGGVVVSPSFAVGRTQHMLYYIHQLIQEKRIPEIPVYVNSPMATKATDVYILRTDAQKLNPDQITEINETARYVESPEESRQLNFLKTPSIILSASGMATGGRVVHHIKNYGPHSKNTLLFNGFQAAGTRGRAIVDGTGKVKILGQEVLIKAEVVHLTSFSAHGDRAEIAEWLEKFPSAPRKTFITHGEPESSEEFSQFLNKKLGWTCIVPEENQEYDL